MKKYRIYKTVEAFQIFKIKHLGQGGARLTDLLSAEGEESMNRSGVGIEHFSLLSVLFSVLKLAGIVDWSWWWVLAPTWVPVLAVIVLVIIMRFGYQE